MKIKAVDPNEWGPSGWKFLHYIALVYPENPTDEDRKNYQDFFISLQNVLPCSKCSENYKKNLDIFPINESLDDNESLFKWTIDIHNEVNSETNKDKYSYEEAFDMYVNKNKVDYDRIMLLSAVSLLILFVIYLKYYV